MGKDLIVGRAGLEGLETVLASQLRGLDLSDDLQRLFEVDEEESTLSLLNAASVAAFLNHVAAVEGHPDGKKAFAAFRVGATQFKNMPWWDNSGFPSNLSTLAPAKTIRHFLLEAAKLF